MITGQRKLIRNLNAVGDRIAKKVARSAIGAGQTVIAKSIRQEVPPRYKELRKAVNKKLKKSRKGGYDAKIGAGVGKQKPPKRSGQNSGGVGISGANIHWAVFGTDDRTVKSTGKAAGKMPAIAAGAVKRGYAKAKGPANAKATKKATETLAKEAAKMKT